MVDLIIEVVGLFGFSKNDTIEKNVNSIWPPVETKIYLGCIVK